ncbi:hypothetical protein [Azospirillum ramasamyi]|uniref:Uncharacterized protein n=1 Tax=Azospirillum ramasamyi TaxID=682998 RepID=A0A2U9SBN4_9PROT|nr:hypothetical protein [Azospirillum ramasamyi]AWU96894.1 hypothetical protein DM194_21755 [Azospirillum ramasamyi]
MMKSSRTAPSATEADGRLVVVNLDRGWPFADLVRRFALDLYGRGITGAVEFRTIGGERGRRDQDSLVWGTRWPRIYGNDTEALLADLFEDLALLHEVRLSDLTIVMVLPHPAEAPQVTEEALALGRRFAERLATVPQVLQKLGRCVAVRDAARSSEDDVRAALGLMGERFLNDPERQGGQPFDGIALLRQSRVRNDAEEAHARQFILLRCLLEIMGRSHERSSGEGTGTAKDAVAAARRAMRGRIVALDLEGNHPILSSERIGGLLNAFYGQAAAQPATGGDPVGDDGVDAPNDEETRVDAILQQIEEEVQARDQEIAPPRPAPQSWNRYLDDATYWSAELEKRFVDELQEDLDSLDEWSKVSLKTLEQRKMSLHQTVTVTRERNVREKIGGLTFVNAGLSGEAAQALKRMKDKVWSKRAELLAMASDSRAKLLFVRVVASETTMPAIPQTEVTADRLALRNIQEYADYRNAAKQAQTSLRRLVPRGYIWLAWLVSAAALGTILAHAAARRSMQAGFLDALLFNGWPILPIAWALATGAGFLMVRRVIQIRRNALRQAVDDLQKARGRLTESVHLAMRAALNYVILTSRIPWLDLLHQELDRRGAENDLGAYTRALVLVRPRAHRKVQLASDEERQFHNRHHRDVAGLRVTRWLPGILVKIDPSADLRPAPLEFALGVDGSRFTLDTTVFLDETKVLLTDVTSDEVPHVT